VTSNTSKKKKKNDFYTIYKDSLIKLKLKNKAWKGKKEFKIQKTSLTNGSKKR
jgi:hypothetical protein